MSAPARPHNAARAATKWAADRVIAVAAEGMWRSAAIDSPGLQRATRAALRWTAGTAHVAKLLPRVDVVRLTGPSWSVTFIGDPYLRRQLEHALLGGEPARELVGRATLWGLQRAVADALDASPLVVCSLPQQFPARWRPTAPLSFRTPVFVDHLLDLTVPLEVHLHGAARAEVRQLIARARALGISARPTREQRDFARFYHDMLVPFQRMRHGPRALVAGYDGLAARVRRHDYELLELVHEGRVVGGSLMRFIGPEAAGEEMGLCHDAPASIARALQTRVFLANIERALERGCRRYRFGGSRAAYHDPVFRAKRRWGARTIARNKLSHPEWTWLARELPEPLARHLNDLGPLTFDDGRSCVIRVPDSDDGGHALRHLDGVEGYLMVSPGQSRFLAPPSPDAGR